MKNLILLALMLVGVFVKGQVVWSGSPDFTLTVSGTQYFVIDEPYASPYPPPYPLESTSLRQQLEFIYSPGIEVHQRDIDSIYVGNRKFNFIGGVHSIKLTPGSYLIRSYINGAENTKRVDISDNIVVLTPSNDEFARVRWHELPTFTNGFSYFQKHGDPFVGDWPVEEYHPTVNFIVRQSRYSGDRISFELPVDSINGYRFKTPYNFERPRVWSFTGGLGREFSWNVNWTIYNSPSTRDYINGQYTNTLYTIKEGESGISPEAFNIRVYSGYYRVIPTDASYGDNRVELRTKNVNGSSYKYFFSNSWIYTVVYSKNFIEERYNSESGSFYNVTVTRTLTSRLVAGARTQSYRTGGMIRGRHYNLNLTN